MVGASLRSDREWPTALIIKIFYETNDYSKSTTTGLQKSTICTADKSSVHSGGKLVVGGITNGLQWWLCGRNKPEDCSFREEIMFSGLILYPFQNLSLNPVDELKSFLS